MVSHPSANCGQSWLSSVISWELVFLVWYSRSLAFYKFSYGICKDFLRMNSFSPRKIRAVLKRCAGLLRRATCFWIFLMWNKINLNIDLSKAGSLVISSRLRNKIYYGQEQILSWQLLTTLLCQTINQSFCQSILLSINPYVNQSFWQSILLSINPSVSQSFCQSILLSVNPSVSQSLCQSILLSINPYVNQFLCPAILLLVNPYVNQSFC